MLCPCRCSRPRSKGLYFLRPNKDFGPVTKENVKDLLQGDLAYSPVEQMSAIVGTRFTCMHACMHVNTLHGFAASSLPLSSLVLLGVRVPVPRASCVPTVPFLMYPATDSTHPVMVWNRRVLCAYPQEQGKLRRHTEGGAGGCFSHGAGTQVRDRRPLWLHEG